MSAALYNFEAERMRRRPYADETVGGLFLLFDRALNAREARMMELINAELKYRAAHGVDIRRDR
jgi:hypothetical protein